ncbi:MAG: hypothetical protein CBB80_009065 [Synechococcus sp. TMED20]|nr:MAG: hypothetical protein CBB80_009065 [Synechococcus sp. TMED20]
MILPPPLDRHRLLRRLRLKTHHRTNRASRRPTPMSRLKRSQHQTPSRRPKPMSRHKRSQHQTLSRQPTPMSRLKPMQHQILRPRLVQITRRPNHRLQSRT